MGRLETSLKGKSLRPRIPLQDYHKLHILLSPVTNAPGKDPVLIAGYYAVERGDFLVVEDTSRSFTIPRPAGWSFSIHNALGPPSLPHTSGLGSSIDSAVLDIQPA